MATPTYTYLHRSVLLLKIMENRLGLLIAYALRNTESRRIQAKHSEVLQKPKTLLWRFKTNRVALPLPLFSSLSIYVLPIAY